MMLTTLHAVIRKTLLRLTAGGAPLYLADSKHSIETAL